MNRIITLVLSAMFIMAPIANALEVNGKIKRIYANGSNLYVRLKDDVCVTGNGYYALYMTSEYVEYMGAVILAAANAGKAITLGVESCPTEADGRADAHYIIQTTEGS